MIENKEFLTNFKKDKILQYLSKLSPSPLSEKRKKAECFSKG